MRALLELILLKHDMVIFHVKMAKLLTHKCEVSKMLLQITELYTEFVNIPTSDVWLRRNLAQAHTTTNVYVHSRSKDCNLIRAFSSQSQRSQIWLADFEVVNLWGHFNALSRKNHKREIGSSFRGIGCQLKNGICL